MRVSIVAIAATILRASAAHAQEAAQNVGPWQIQRFDGGCFMEAAAPDGTHVVYEIDDDDGSLALLLGNARWTSLASRAEVNLTVQFRSYRLLTRRFAVEAGQEIPFVRIPIPDRFARNMFPMMITVSVTYGTDTLFIHNPTRVDEVAINATRTCAGVAHDPFAS